MKGLLSAAGTRRRYRGMIGTGGIGSGSFFLLDGKRDPRPRGEQGRQVPGPQGLLQAPHHQPLRESPARRRVRVSTRSAGWGTTPRVRACSRRWRRPGWTCVSCDRIADAPTLFSFCFLYPDGSGGNLTTDDSASGRVGPEPSSEAAPGHAGPGGSAGLRWPFPRSPWTARAALLEDAARTASFGPRASPAPRWTEARGRGLLETVDLLAVNRRRRLPRPGLPDAAQRSGRPSVAGSRRAYLPGTTPRLRLSVTAGQAGSWSWDGETPPSSMRPSRWR